MRRTFLVRRQDILENPVPLSSLFVKYPTLKDPDEVSKWKLSIREAIFCAKIVMF